MHISQQRLDFRSNLPRFKPALDQFLQDIVLDIEQWPGLRELAWNRVDRWIPAEEALAIYERNWRFVDPQQLSQDELELIDRLKQQYGDGVLNA